jgi:hypothetical protein
MDVVLVVDTSGSMAWDIAGRKKSDPRFQGPPRIDRVVAALQKFVEKLPDQARLRLISFNNGVKTDIEFKDIDKSVKKQIAATIDGLRKEVAPDGNTYLPEAMEKGLMYADQYASQDPDITATLYVLTDGKLDYGDERKNAASQNFLSQVLTKPKHVGTDRLYASLVMLGKLERNGGSFPDKYFEDLDTQGGEKCDVEIDEEFNPLFPAVLKKNMKVVLPGDDVEIYEGSSRPFVKTVWEVDGKEQASPDPITLSLTNLKAGKHVITFKGFDKEGSERRARARLVLNVGQEPVKAVPEIFIDGKSLASAGQVIQGQELVLKSDKSTGPIAKRMWSVNGDTFDVELLKQPMNKIGTYEIALTVESERTPEGVVSTNRSALISFQVVPPRLMAQPEVTVNGKPLADAGPIHPGAMLALTSKNKTNAKSFEWIVGGKPLTGQMVNWEVPSAGTYQIVHTVVGDSENRDTAAPISITAVDPALVAIPEVLYNGKPFSQSSNIYVGQTLQLVSKSSGPVTSATWTVNGEKIPGAKVPWPISQPGQIEIKLRVEGQNPALVNESDVVKVFAKKRPPVWALWALGILEVGILAFFGWLLTGNQVRDCRLIITNGPRPQVRKFFSRFSKTATIPFNKMLKSKEYWRKAPDRDAVVISRQSVAKGPAVKLACTFAPARRGTSDVQFGESKPATNTERFYLLEDGRNPEQPQSVEFTLQSAKKSLGDTLMLAAVAAALVAAFFWFYLKVYPAL